MWYVHFGTRCWSPQEDKNVENSVNSLPELIKPYKGDWNQWMAMNYKPIINAVNVKALLASIIFRIGFSAHLMCSQLDSVAKMYCTMCAAEISGCALQNECVWHQTNDDECELSFDICFNLTRWIRIEKHE